MYNSIFELIKNLVFDGTFPALYCEEFTGLLALVFSCIALAIPIIVVVYIVLTVISLACEVFRKK